MQRLLNRMSTPKLIVFSFAFVIFTGSLLLSLPFAQLPTSEASYFDHLFNAVSAVCVTGLFIESIADSYNLFGKIIMLLLIQTGGLGLITLFGYVLGILNRKMDYRQKQAMTTAINYDSIGGSRNFISGVIKYTFVIESVGALLLAFHFVPERGIGEGLFTSIFLAVSAFCNAGFDPFGNVSLIAYDANVLVNLTISTLIILGGIGFGVWFDVTDGLQKFTNPKTHSHRTVKQMWNKLRPHTKLAVTMTILLITIGTVSVLAVEWNNPATLANRSFGDKLLISYFQSVTMRTAGFATMDYTLAEPTTILIWSYLMFIGGSPGGAAGGLKTTTFAILLFFLRDNIRGREHVTFGHNRIPRQTVKSAIAVGTLYIGAMVIGVTALQLFEPGQPLNLIVFEVISALATVGVSAALTPILSTASQIVLMLLMFSGRIGPLTLVLSLNPNRTDPPVKKDVKYAETNVLVG